MNGVITKIKNGFTLAEVLITLVVVGVIAALTIPTLVNRYQKEQTPIRLKKAYSTLAQAVARAVADNGSISNWEFSSSSTQEVQKFYEQYLFPYLSIAQNCNFDNTGKCKYEYSYLNSNEKVSDVTRMKFYLADGTLVLGTTNVNSSFKEAYIYVDINGQKGPNQMGRDLFFFIISSYGRGEYSDRLIPHCMGSSRYFCMNSGNNYGCNKNEQGFNCATIIMYDGWQIKDDYPW